ncbi:hypothetical protein E2C01_018104 [Portunus trituberculatus]|uniref:Uncharacterized protein n=1 Tax=Portunus trituberculatus TaxID=210409 RepID=A0A5B7DVA1_PORTR|nr:hypothetical protein [Portunus trituberculatus]
MAMGSGNGDKCREPEVLADGEQIHKRHPSKVATGLGIHPVCLWCNAGGSGPNLEWQHLRKAENRCRVLEILAGWIGFYCPSL